MRNLIKAPGAKRFIRQAGGYTVVARHLGIKVPSVYNWRVIPAEQVLKLEEISEYSRYQMRPDVFGKDPEKKRASA